MTSFVKNHKDYCRVFSMDEFQQNCNICSYCGFLYLFYSFLIGNDITLFNVSVTYALKFT